MIRALPFLFALLCWVIVMSYMIFVLQGLAEVLHETRQNARAIESLRAAQCDVITGG